MALAKEDIQLINLNGVVEPVSHRESEAAGARIV